MDEVELAFLQWPDLSLEIKDIKIQEDFSFNLQLSNWIF